MDWSSHPLTSALVARLKESPNQMETRDLLKPLFKLCKESSPHFNFETAFLYVDYLISLSISHSSSITVPLLPQIQPRYALNTLIVMAQRQSRADYALRAYDLLKRHNYQADVFTLTALIDVVGRQGSLAHAREIFESMLLPSSTLLPNIVTFVTMLRLAGMNSDYNSTKSAGNSGRLREEGIELMLFLLKEAEHLRTNPRTIISLPSSSSSSSSSSSVTLTSSDYGAIAREIAADISLYNAAFAVCVRLSSDLSEAITVLTALKRHQVVLNSVSYEILAKLSAKLGPSQVPLSQLEFYLQPSEYTNLCKAIETFASTSSSSSSPHNAPRTLYNGCLGADASPQMRQSVMMHDLMRLVDRIDPLLHGDVRNLSEQDFATLIHQVFCFALYSVKFLNFY